MNIQCDNSISHLMMTCRNMAYRKLQVNMRKCYISVQILPSTSNKTISNNSAYPIVLHYYVYFMFRPFYQPSLTVIDHSLLLWHVKHFERF